MDSDAQEFPAIRRLQPYKCTAADRKFRQKVKRERGHVCECCGASDVPEKLAVHHILETRTFPQYAREALNMIVLCERCHTNITSAAQLADAAALRFYASLPSQIRERHLPFLVGTKVARPGLLDAFQRGNVEYWNDRAVGDLTR